MILGMQREVIGGNILKITITPYGPYRNRYIAVFVNGKYTGRNYLLPASGDLSIVTVIPSAPGAASVYLEDAGDFASFSAFAPDELAKMFDGLTAPRLKMHWQPGYTVSQIVGTGQIGIASVVGAVRGGPLTTLSERPTRVRIFLSVTTVGDRHIVRAWNNNQIVAEGAVIGSSAVDFTLVSANNSNLKITGTLIYTGDLAPNVAWFDLRWPSAYQVHYALLCSSLAVYTSGPFSRLTMTATSRRLTFPHRPICRSIYHRSHQRT
ncbi:MAG TPA: hypothetical protein VGP72_32025 [Planctomycetota bacterium]|jgi:hypothetical protein